MMFRGLLIRNSISKNGLALALLPKAWLRQTLPFRRS